MIFDLRGQAALVTGASRGIGKGVALGLGECGATVYITGRSSSREELPDDITGTIYETAEQVEKLGGKCIPIKCDHRNDNEVETVFKRIADEQGKLNILVNNVWGGYEKMAEMTDGGFVFTWANPFWEQPLWRWDAMFQAGVRAHFVSSRLAARLMIQEKKGLIVNISYWAAQKFMGNAIYGVAKASTDKMTRDMAVNLKDYNVASVSLYPGLVRTESVMKSAEYFDMSNSESPQFIGRAVAALASDNNVIRKTGEVLIAAELGLEYGFLDIDGKQPRPVFIDEAQ